MKSNNSVKTPLLTSLVAVMGLTLHAPASALDTTAIISAGVEHSNNINLSDDDIPIDIPIDIPGNPVIADIDGPRSDVQRQLRLDVGLAGSTAQFDTELAYAFTARDFKNDFQTDDEVVDGNARILWTPLPERFAWELTNNVTNNVRDDRLADTPDNREQRNIFVTGPNFIFRLSPIDRLSAEYRYVDVSVDNSNDDDEVAATRQQGSDSERQIGRLRLTHNLSFVSDFLVSAEYEDVESTLDVAYTRLLIGYAARLRHGSYAIYIGTNKVEPGIGDDFDTAAYNLVFTHDFGGHRLDLTLIKEATDTSIGFGGNDLRSETFNPRDSNFNSFDIIKRQRADITYQNSLICDACRIRLSGFYDDQDYQTDPDNQDAQTQAGDQKRYGVTLGLVYALRQNVDVQIGADFDVSEFLDDPAGLKYESTDYLFGINYNFFRDLSVGLRVVQTTRDANVEGLDFEELRGGINLAYVF